MRLPAAALLLTFLFIAGHGQALSKRADSIRKKYKIPELVYAVVSSDRVLDTGYSGVKRAGTKLAAERDDRFHIGSNTKAVTSVIAAMVVKRERLKWDTRFFDLFPELLKDSDPAYREMTLNDLVCFRAPLPKYTYTNPEPRVEDMRGDYAAQRYQLASFLVHQKAEGKIGDYRPTNAPFILAGLMIEKAAGRDFKTLVGELGAKLGINFGFDYPNLTDETQPWGHDENLKPLPPADNPKLNWLLAAGNINVTLPDYIRFVRFQMRWLAGRPTEAEKATFEFPVEGYPEFAHGWFWKINDGGRAEFTNTGNAGAFVTEVLIVPDTDRAYIIFTNSAREVTSAGIANLLSKLKGKYH